MSVDSKINLNKTVLEDQNSLAFISSGEMEEGVVDRLRVYSRIVAVNGGLRYCDAVNIQPHSIVGDFDSLHKQGGKSDQVNLLTKYSSVKQLALARAKDQTDLEAALITEKVDKCAKATVFGALGKRPDHALHNLFLLLRYPGQLFLETQKEKVFALRAEQTPYTLDVQQGEHLSVLPLIDDPSSVRYQSMRVKGMFAHLEEHIPETSPSFHQGEVKIFIDSGTTLFTLSKHSVKIPTFPQKGPIEHDFSLKTPLTSHFHLFHHLNTHLGKCHISNKDIELFIMNPSFSTKSFATQKGQTISLLPLYTSAKEVNSVGLKWELDDTTLNIHFLGTSNVAKGDRVTLTLGSGTLICINNKTLIDLEMLSLKDNSKTANLCTFPNPPSDDNASQTD